LTGRNPSSKIYLNTHEHNNIAPRTSIFTMMEPNNNSSADDDGIHLLDYLIVLTKYSRMIIYASLAVMLVTYLILLILPNKYTSTARLLPPQQNMTLSAQILSSLGADVTFGSGPGGGMAAGLLGLKSPSDLYVAMLNCDSLLDRIIARFNLMKVYKEKYSDDARKTLRKRSNITTANKNTIISIEVTDKDAKRAAEIANAFIEELDKLLQRLAHQEARKRLAFLENERVQAVHNLTKAEETLRTFSEKNSVLQIDAQTRGAIEYIAKLRGEIDAKEVQIQVLRQQATPFNYDVVRLETESKGLKEKLRAAETQHGDCVSDVCLPSSKAPGIGLEYLRLFREAKFQESLYLLYVKLVETARMDMARNFDVIHVLDPGIPPQKRSNKRLLPSILAGMITFFMMVFVAFGREYLQNVNTREDDVRRLSVLKDYSRPWKDMLIRIKGMVQFKRNF
jgi:tyrosine-protein kinase Etk/Wzc